MTLPPAISLALSRLEAAGFEAYVVGGCVRDSLMGFEPHDYDITTSATPEETERVFCNERVIETGIKHGTVTILLSGTPVEITTYRVDGEYSDSRRPDSVSFTRDIREDTARRDFTMNGIAYNPQRGYVDIFAGEDDINHGIIRCIGDPDERFQEDALRIMRAMRFSASLGFEIEPKTAEAMMKNKELLKNISNERIFSELCGLLSGRRSAENIRRVLSEFREILAVIIPEIRDTFDFEQHSKYHCFDVYTHCIVSAECAAGLCERKEDALPLALAMLLHDIGKPRCFSLGENGEGHFYGHAAVSAEIAEGILRRLKCSNAFRQRVCTIVKYHDVPLIDNDKAVRRLLTKHGLEATHDICLAHMADDMAKKPECAERCRTWRAVLERACQNQEIVKLRLAVNGNDLAGLVKPSPLMGEVLRYLYKGVADGIFTNEREFLLREAKRQIERSQKGT